MSELRQLFARIKKRILIGLIWLIVTDSELYTAYYQW